MSDYPNYQTPPNDAPMSGMIPYRNVPALIGYYLGVFSILPCVGFPMGIAAIVLGVMGLRRAAAHPEAKGKAHAIVAIVCGAIFGFAWLILDVLILVGLLASAHG